jgi:hypothetical protein
LPNHSTSTDKSIAEKGSTTYTLLDVDIVAWSKKWQLDIGPLSLRIDTSISQNPATQEFALNLGGAVSTFGRVVPFSKNFAIRKGGSWEFEIISDRERIEIDISNWNYASRTLTFDLVLKVGINVPDIGWNRLTVHSGHTTVPITPREQLDQLFKTDFATPALLGLLLSKPPEIHEIR